MCLPANSCLISGLCYISRNVQLTPGSMSCRYHGFPGQDWGRILTRIELSAMQIKPHSLRLTTGDGISLHDITPQIRSYLGASAIRAGFVTVTSQHTTTALAINENEERLLEDVKRFLERLIPSQDSYLHNDIHLRDCPPDEPENAHSHLAAMLLGSSEVIPVNDGKLMLGQYQSVMLYELDGPRERTVAIRIYGE